MRRVYCNPLWPSTNQKIQNYLDDQNYAQHRNRVQTAKPAIDNKAPTSYYHLRVKLKKIQLEAERHAKVMQDNILLLKRMSDILHSKGPLGYQQEARPKTRSGVRKKPQTGANRDFVVYEQTSDKIISKWEKEWQTKLDIITQMTESAKRKTAKPDSNLCPRYIRDFGDQTSQKWVLPKIAPHAKTSPRKTIQINSTCVPKLGDSEVRLSKSAILPRPKAATGSRKLSIPQNNNNSKTVKNGDENEIENKVPIILSDQFKIDFPYLFNSDN